MRNFTAENPRGIDWASFGPCPKCSVGAGEPCRDLRVSYARYPIYEPHAVRRAPKKHRYTSTACVHALHDKCRHICKWCDASCRCSCHLGQEDA